MPDLAQSLGTYDLGYLQIVAELWGIEFKAAELSQGIDKLIPLMLDQQLVDELIETLPDEARTTVADLIRNGGRLPWAFFTRAYGEIREMGSGRRDRDRPYLNPVSTAEFLFYRALVGRAFFDSPRGPEEFAYIPQDLIPFLKADEDFAGQEFGREASPGEKAYQIPATDRILDDTCTVLAALRLELPEQQIPLNDYPGRFPLTIPYMKMLLSESGLLDKQEKPLAEPVRFLLEAGRGAALAQLAMNWLGSIKLNDLAFLPHILFEGEWSNDPLRARESILQFMANIPKGKWWNIASFVTAIYQQYPDFQRPAGDYDSWFIRHAEHGEYLRGFENWDQIEGELIRFVVSGPLHWLGILDLAAPREGNLPTAFRFSRWAEALLQGQVPENLPREDHKISVHSDGRVIVSPRVPRSVRYQLARFSEWDGIKRETYQYHLTPSSLSRASISGLHTDHLLSLLRKYADHVPPSLVKALVHWQEHGRQARMEQVYILRLGSPDILQELRASRAARFLGDPLGPTTVIVKPGAREKVLAALAELGYLGEIVDGQI
ncbi:MAG: helicase-associated domain-containing protein [Chloroflexota bacterium]|nr:MAG: helicase-associated domain-containing protein [Chloroflexota bacterium]